MDSLKRKRTQQRREFTVAANAFETTIHSDDADEIEIAFQMLSETADNLLPTEAAVRDIWCDSDDFDEAAFQADQDKALEYRQRWLNLQNRYRKLAKPSISKVNSNSSLQSTVKSVLEDHEGMAKKRINMPKLDLVKFDGNVKNWLLFWGQFKRIHEDTYLEDIDKFQFLLQATVVNSCARQLVETYPPSGENYHKAIGALKARFARDDVLIETYVRGLLNLVLMRQRGQTSDLTSLYDSLQTHLQALETLGVAKDKYASVLFPMIESALPEDILRTWNRIRASNDTKGDDLSKLIQFLRQEVESEERVQMAREGFISYDTPSGWNQPTACFISKSKTENNISKSSKPISCIWCDKENHASSECHKAIKFTLLERQEFLKNKRACTICLRPNHESKKCKSFPKCLYCKKRHVTLMCTELNNKSSDSPNSKSDHVDVNNTEKSTSMLCQLKSTTVLQTLAVKIVNGKKEICVRALIDSGSQRSYVRKDAIKKLNMKPSGKETMSHCLFGGVETKTEECFKYNLCIKSTVNNFNCVISVLEQQELCGLLPKVNSTIIEQLRQKSITLTDVSDCPDEISILIGADFSGFLLTGEILHLDNNLTAVNTKLGWTVQGPITGIFSSVVSMTTTLHCLSKIDISDLWNLESLGIRDPAEQLSKSDHEKEILDNFNKTISINCENRYEVQLPWRDNMPRPQSNYYTAKKRLLSTTARLENLDKLSDYDAAFQEWLKLNIIELAPDQDDTNGGMFLPHHAVIKESSQTTKIRPVFDASAKDVNGISLNACLHKGSNLIELIPELLIGFRKETIGVIADIAKAFLQISLNPDDRNYLKFLWWSNINEPKKSIITYRHRRVVFGVKSSPFHLAATISHHLEYCPPHLKDTASMLKKSFYVDNCVTSVDTVDSMQKFIKEAKEVMMLGNFNLRCWVTAPEKVDTQGKTISVLGIVWNTDSDTLSCNVTSITHPENVKITKRSLLSVTQKIFDPIGVCCPATIVPKLILQEAWSRNTKWDEELPAELKKKFQDWMQDIHLISEIQMPRRLSTDSITNCKKCLHVFSDASLHAYSMCIFLRSECNGKVSVSLVLAKSRVTPLKNITIPRLELIAATLATRMTATVIRSLNLPDCQVQYWTDSSVVLSWIQGDGEWSVFVANRVREIKQSTNINDWKHVPGDMNPADLPSRGTSIKGLLESRWWLGPSWLLTPSENWPTSAGFPVDTALVDEERRRKSVNVMLVEENTFLDTITYFSSYTKIIRMISWILRWKYRTNRKNIELTCHEIEYAEKVLFRKIQANNINKIEKLQTFKDKDGLIRLETKLGLTNETYDFKSPIILPGTNVIIQRMIQERHRILQHAGTQTLMANIRESLWIIGIRKLTKKIVRDCVVCKRYKTKAPQSHRASLPSGRLEASSAFEVSGVDLAGPLILKTGTKCWIVLFTCATYRAVHLEITESLSTNDFISALRRFIARRGRVKQIYSDNGTNFTGFNNCLKSVDWNQLLCFSSIARIKWIFIPPGAPWWGGFYERLVGVMKNILRRVLGRASLTLVELQTVLCDCEATINNRPLTYITNSQDDLKPLTPSMFIQPLIEHGVPDLDVIDGKSLNIRSAYCQKIREDLRRRFRSEYISNLIHKGKQHHTAYEIKIGDVVLLEIENEKRLQWPLAVVTEVYVGSDGHIRAAKVRTASGERVRPLQRLYPLEITYDRHDFTERPSTTVTRSGRTVNLPSRFADCF